MDKEMDKGFWSMGPKFELLTNWEIEMARKMDGDYMDKCWALRPCYTDGVEVRYGKFPELGKLPELPGPDDETDDDLVWFLLYLWYVEDDLRRLDFPEIRAETQAEIRDNLGRARRKIYKLRRKPWWKDWKTSILFALECVEADLQKKEADLQKKANWAPATEIPDLDDLDEWGFPKFPERLRSNPEM